MHKHNNCDKNIRENISLIFQAMTFVVVLISALKVIL